MKTVLLALLVLSVLAGCATQAQRQLEQTKKAIDVAVTNENKCIKPIRQSPAFERLDKRFIFGVDDPRTVEKLALKTYVTEQEVKDFFDYSERNIQCQSASLKDYSKVHPEYVAYMANSYAELNSAVAMVVNKELTIGDYNQRRVNIINRARAEYYQVGQRITSQLNQAHQYELAQRQTAQQELQKWNYQQQVLANQRQALNIQQQAVSKSTFNPIQPFTDIIKNNRTRTTTCRYIGNTLRCTHN